MKAEGTGLMRAEGASLKNKGMAELTWAKCDLGCSSVLSGKDHSSLCSFPPTDPPRRSWATEKLGRHLTLDVPTRWNWVLRSGLSLTQTIQQDP